ncbi:hypothetical protein ACIPN8_22510 [Streptomyces sp. NPDC086082]|uniref:hypothetical protein n=1 Tax=Streptomyces sp. NPDC086082 TaxID=3365750 RepID=UPI0037F72522
MRLTGQGVGRCLRRWGLSFQRPGQRSARRRRLRVVRCSSPTRVGRTWGAKGCTPVVRRAGGRFSVNAMSAISRTGRMHFMVFTEDFRRRRHVPLPGAPRGPLCGHKVRACPADHPDRIELHFLPS